MKKMQKNTGLAALASIEAQVADMAAMMQKLREKRNQIRVEVAASSPITVSATKWKGHDMIELSRADGWKMSLSARKCGLILDNADQIRKLIRSK